jgi:circadian clock protein KaiB
MKARKTKKNRRAKPVPAKLPDSPARDKYVLRLFVAGATARSRQAIMHVRTLCETSLKGRVKLEVIDIYQQPGLACENQIVATPTLIIVLPLPVRRFIGNLTTIADLFCLFDLGGKGRIVL